VRSVVSRLSWGGYDGVMSMSMTPTILPWQRALILCAPSLVSLGMSWDPMKLPLLLARSSPISSPSSLMVTYDRGLQKLPRTRMESPASTVRGVTLNRRRG
jgi:hypothetical protein